MARCIGQRYLGIRCTEPSVRESGFCAGYCDQHVSQAALLDPPVDAMDALVGAGADRVIDRLTQSASPPTAPPTASSSARPESAESLAIHEEGGRLTGGPVGRQTRSDERRGRPCGIIAARARPTTSRATTR